MLSTKAETGADLESKSEDEDARSFVVAAAAFLAFHKTFSSFPMNSILADVIGDKLFSCSFVQKGKWYMVYKNNKHTHAYGCVLRYRIASHGPKGARRSESRMKHLLIWRQTSN